MQPSQLVWLERFVAKHFVIKYQVLDCMIVQQNMVTLCNGTQNYNLQHKKACKTSLLLVNWLIFVEFYRIVLHVNCVIHSWIGTWLCPWISGLKAIINLLSKRPGGNVQKKRDFDLQDFDVHLKCSLKYVLLIHQYLLQMHKWMVAALRGHPHTGAWS